jgi:hypothetical protein
MSARVASAIATVVLAMIASMQLLWGCNNLENGAAPLSLQPYHNEGQFLMSYGLLFRRQGLNDRLAQHRHAL